MAKKTNLNKKKPEHHNIFYSDDKPCRRRRRLILSASGQDRWNSKRIDEILNTYIEAKTQKLQDIIG